MLLFGVEWFAVWDEQNNNLLMILAAATVMFLGCLIAAYAYYSKKSERDTDLKRDMIARGMSADEIGRVMAAGGTPKPELKETQPYVNR